MIEIDMDLILEVKKKLLSEKDKEGIGSITIKLPGVSKHKLKLKLTPMSDNRDRHLPEGISWVELLNVFFIGLSEMGYSLEGVSPHLLAEVLQVHTHKEWRVVDPSN